MEEKRKELLKLDDDKKKLEEKIMTLTEYLTQPGMPGIDGSLIDEEGFPKSGLDLMAIRTARHDLVISQNDHKMLMEKIEQKMMEFFAESNNNKKEDDKKKKINYKEEIPADACFDDDLNKSNKKKETNKNNINNMPKEPFAIIASVMKDSPAEEAGLQLNDAILSFNDILYKGVSLNPLMTLSEIVKDKIGKEIPMCIVRKNNNNVLEIKNLIIKPHQWNGKGVLGCKFNLL